MFAQLSHGARKTMTGESRQGALQRSRWRIFHGGTGAYGIGGSGVSWRRFLSVSHNCEVVSLEALALPITPLDTAQGGNVS